MKICKIYIKGFQQFQDVELDFTNPETGEPLDKICFIGSNGTGKSTVLRLIADLLKILYNLKAQKNSTNFPLKNLSDFTVGKDAKVLFKITNDNIIYFVFYDNSRVLFFKSNETVLSNFDLIKEIFSNRNFFVGNKWTPFIETTINDKFETILNNEFISTFKLRDNFSDLIINSPVESKKNGYQEIIDVPKTNVNEALELIKHFPVVNIVSPDQVNIFWKILVYNLRKRAEERDKYENLPESLVKTKQQLIDEFDSFYPKILNELARVWDAILNKAGLFFDVKGASNPYQLTDNLLAYVKLKNSNKVIPYNELSTGIRNYIFRVGHIFSLYFNREIDRGFLLVDEPENSLYPDFLFNLIEIYQKITLDKRGKNNTQMFFATHNPIIAAQFQPYERIILDWNEDGSVNAKKGISPVGDDPNDILVQDFEVKELMTSKGVEVWNKYLQMKNELRNASTKEERFRLAGEISKIGLAYNFPA